MSVHSSRHTSTSSRRQAVTNPRACNSQPYHQHTCEVSVRCIEKQHWKPRWMEWNLNTQTSYPGIICSLFGDTALKSAVHGDATLKLAVLNGAVLEHINVSYLDVIRFVYVTQRWKLWWMELSLNTPTCLISTSSVPCMVTQRLKLEHTNVSYLDVVCSVYGDTALKAWTHKCVLPRRRLFRV